MAASRTFHKNLIENSQTQTSATNVSSAVGTRHLARKGRPCPAGEPFGHPRQSLADVFEPPSVDGLHPAALSAELPRLKRDASGSRAGELPPSAGELYRKTPQDLRRSWKVEASFGNVLFHLVKNGWLEQHVDDDDDVKHTLSAMNPEWAAVIEYVPMLAEIDFLALRLPDPDYATRKEISKHLVWLMAACAVYYDLDFGLVLRYLSGEYTGEWRDVNEIVRTVSPYVTDSDAQHIRRILETGCPFEFNWEQTTENKEIFVRRGNSPSIAANWPSVLKTLAKEVRNKHLMVFPRWMVRASPFANHVPANVIVRRGKKDRLIWDGSTKQAAHEVTMNEVTPIANEAEITFGHMYLAFIVWIWQLRISFPDEDILLAFLDISSCFRFPRIFADVVGAFGFVIGPWFFAPNAMVFGSVTSASSWEPFRRAIAAVALAGFFVSALVAKHKSLLDMIRWAPPPPEGTHFVKAKSCSKNRGIFDADGSAKPTPHHIYVDDNLLADTRARMAATLAAGIDAIFKVMGYPDTDVRPCALAMDKWEMLVVSHIMVLLGLVFDTRRMTVGVTNEFRKEVLELLTTTWHDGRGAFTVGEMEKLVGKLGRIGQAFRPIYHLMPQLYASLAYALRQNAFYLAATSRRFRAMLRQMKLTATTVEDAREINFAMKTVAKKTHGAKERYRIPDSLKHELGILRRLIGDKAIRLETPFAHIVPRDWDFEAGADACKRAGGGWSINLSFWWHLEFPADIVERAYLPNGKDKRYVSINVLEMVCVIVNFAAAIHCCHVDGVDLSNYPGLLNWCDNTSACAWINCRCKTSLLGRKLALLFLGLLMGTDLGIQAEWLPTALNVIADDISRLTDERGYYDYAQLLTDHPSLASCRKFQPSPTLLGMIWDVLRKNVSPDPLTVRKLSPLTLGSVTSSDS